MTKIEAVYLDRDDTLIYDYCYMNLQCPIRLYPSSITLLRHISNRLIPIHIISNQSGVARGLISHADVVLLNNRLRLILRELYHVNIVSSQYCYHSPDSACNCRKPKPTLLLRSCHEYAYNISNVLFIGDRISDIAMAHAASTKGLLFQPRTSSQPELFSQLTTILTYLDSH